MVAPLAPELPGLTHQLMYRLKNDDLVVHTRDREIQQLKTQLARGQHRTACSVVGVGLLVTAVLAEAHLDAVDGSGWIAGVAALIGIGFLARGWLPRRQP